MVIERAREAIAHEAGAEVKRDIETKGESVDHAVEIAQEGLVAKIAVEGQEVEIEIRGLGAEGDQEMTAQSRWMRQTRTMKNDR